MLDPPYVLAGEAVARGQPLSMRLSSLSMGRFLNRRSRQRDAQPVCFSCVSPIIHRAFQSIIRHRDVSFVPLLQQNEKA